MSSNNSKLTEENILKILEQLSVKRPVFFNESDFQFSLAKQIGIYLEESKLFSHQILLEAKNQILTEDILGGEREDGSKYVQKIFNQYFDIIIIDKDNNKYYPIELKYKTVPLLKSLEADYYDLKLKFHLTNQGAQDLRCAYFLEDLQRLTNLKNKGKLLFDKFSYEKGFAIFITNDKYYWRDNVTGTFENLWLQNGNCLKECKLTKDTKLARQLFKRNRPSAVKNEDYITEYLFKFDEEIHINWTLYSLSGDYGFYKLVVSI